MIVHIFGAVSSPSCATFALLKTADDNQNQYSEHGWAQLLMFLTFKAGIAPAAVLAVHLDQIFGKELQFVLGDSIFLTDSMTVLQYIFNRNRRFKTYVANCISIIHYLSKVEQ